MVSEFNHFIKTQPVEDYKTARPHDCKTDLSDFTFLMPLRIDSRERKENADTVINSIFKHFDTSFIVLEADGEQKYFPEFSFEGFQYSFFEDPNEIFRKTILINRLIAMSKTPYLAIWDADAIAPPEQILFSAKILRSGNAVMSLPFDGRFYACDKISSDLFKKYLNIEILKYRIPVMHLMHGYHSPGGAYMVCKETYIEAGGENENFIGWGPEDFEHIKRMEVLNLPVHYSIGTLFHLWHPCGKNSGFINAETEKQNRRELIKTCKSQI